MLDSVFTSTTFAKATSDPLTKSNDTALSLRDLSAASTLQFLCFLQIFSSLILGHLLFPDPPLASCRPRSLVPAAPLRDQSLVPFCLPPWKWHLTTQHELLYDLDSIF